MHHHCEVIIPPVPDIEKALEQIMNPFYEGCEESEDNECHTPGFWDFYISGGRFAGTKEMCAYDEDKLKIFFEKLQEEKVTVSGLQSGKQEISPASQIPIVDGIWNGMFPTENGEITPCPLFKHSNNQYDGDDLISCDICRVEDIPDELKCARVIVAGPCYPKYTNDEIEATFMLCDSQWNGVNHMPIDWNGNVKSALDMFQKRLKNYREEYKERMLPKENWLCITVDYHS